jgi:glutathione S-transferase
MMRLLGRATSGNVMKVVWLLEELGTPYNREDYGRQFNNTGDAAYLKLNPNGKVPTLVDGDVVVWESNTILRYIAGVSGEKGARMLPGDPARRSQVERWMDWQLAAVYQPHLGLFREAKKAPEERAATWAADETELGVQFAILDGALAGRQWITGGEMTLADIALGPMVHRCLGFPVTLPKLDNLRAWHGRIAARPAFRKAVG